MSRVCNDVGLVELSIELNGIMVPVATTSFQRLIATLCLLAFGLGQSVFATVGVLRCTDSAGESRVEFGCVKSARGDCGKSDASDLDILVPTERTAPTPCQDETIVPHDGQAKLVQDRLSLDLLFAVHVVVTLTESMIYSPAQYVAIRPLVRDHPRPPEGLAVASTIVLIL